MDVQPSFFAASFRGPQQLHGAAGDPVFQAERDCDSVTLEKPALVRLNATGEVLVATGQRHFDEVAMSRVLSAGADVGE